MPTGVYERTPEHRKKISLGLKGFKRKPITDEHRLHLSLSHIGKNKGEQHWAWKKDGPQKVPLHQWVERQLGTPRQCENCSNETLSRYEWANLSGEYKRDLSDWARLCVRCHRWIDDNTRKAWVTRRDKVKENLQ